jgi:hypothetical protein
MACERIQLPNGCFAIVCGTRYAGPKERCACGKVATLLCDWKVKGKRSGTCDTPICRHCTYSPAPEKDLCKSHTAEWKSRPKAT